MGAMPRERSRDLKKKASQLDPDEVSDYIMDKVTRWTLKELGQARDINKHDEIDVDFEKMRVRLNLLLEQATFVTEILRGER